MRTVSPRARSSTIPSRSARSYVACCAGPNSRGTRMTVFGGSSVRTSTFDVAAACLDEARAWPDQTQSGLLPGHRDSALGTQVLTRGHLQNSRAGTGESPRASTRYALRDRTDRRAPILDSLRLVQNHQIPRLTGGTEPWDPPTYRLVRREKHVSGCHPLACSLIGRAAHCTDAEITGHTPSASRHWYTRLAGTTIRQLAISPARRRTRSAAIA